MAKLPSWLRIKRQRTYPDYIERDIALEPLSFLQEAMANLVKDVRIRQAMFLPAFRQAAQIAMEWEAQMNRMAAMMARPYRLDPVRLAGLEAKHYVRGGLDPQYADPAQRDTYARLLASGRTSDPFLMLLGPEDRSKLAAAFLLGWVEHRAEDPCRSRCQHAEALGAPAWASCADGVDRCPWYLA